MSIADRGLHYGDGLFETIRIHQGKLFQWDQHWTRLQTGCDALNMPLFAKKGEWVEHIQALLKKNQTEQGLARIHVSRGPGPRGYAPSNSATPTPARLSIQQTNQRAPSTPALTRSSIHSQRDTMSSKRGRGGTTGAKFRMTLGLPVAAVINCAGAFGASLLACCLAPIVVAGLVDRSIELIA